MGIFREKHSSREYQANPAIPSRLVLHSVLATALGTQNELYMYIHEVLGHQRPCSTSVAAS